ncbi:hypothetical protein BpHYR1_040516 [Brachionus plicatilis]|uniref:Uncharacterized protein n=1 Tax=Brachionus plicatilis TaxID=10195 RepID=A0A3M7T1L2_BRAPC|nr:hypothetical protein BpHYR1_040516 [Brachionus plicatilis]
MEKVLRALARSTKVGILQHLKKLNLKIIANATKPNQTSPSNGSDVLGRQSYRWPAVRIVGITFSLEPLVVDIWNGLSTRAVNAVSLNSFKAIIDRETAKALNGPGAILAMIFYDSEDNLIFRSCKISIEIVVQILANLKKKNLFR